MNAEPRKPHTPASAPAVGVVEWLRPGDYELVETLLADLKRMGITHLRTGVSWAEYHTPGGRDWYAWLLPRLAKDVDVLPCVTYTPPSIGEVEKTSSPPADLKAYADFLDVLVTDHGDCFEWVELWNEPNNLNDWDWRIDPSWRKFANMIIMASYWMHQRGKKTVLGGMCPTDPNWVQLMREYGALDNIDAISLHGFPGTWTHDGQTWARQVEEVRAALADLDRPMEFWITEAGYSTWRHDEPTQTEVFLDLLKAPVERAYWYAWSDLHKDIPSQEGFHVDERHYHFGLRTPEGRPKLLFRLLERGGIDAVARVDEHLCHRPDAAAPAVTGKAEKPVLITGGAGFLGSNIAHRLAAEGRHVRIFDNLSRGGVEDNLAWLIDSHPGRIEPVPGDIRDRWTVRDVVKEAESVFHLAAQVAVTTSVNDPREDFDINLGGVMNVLEAAREMAEAPRLVFASTNKVYGALSDIPLALQGDRHAPVDEDARRYGVSERQPLELYSPYGCSKGGADQYVIDHARIYGLPAAVFRMSCLYGPRQFGTEDQGWVAHFMIQALKGEPITLFGDGKQVRDVLFVDDIVDAYLLAERRMKDVQGRAFNMGGGPRNAVSLIEAIRAIERLTGRSVDVSFGDWRPGDQPWYVSDTRTFESLTGWRPRVGVEDGFARLRDWLVAHGFGSVAAETPEPEERVAV
ncbi:NAD-dependent epimerase/dehydratase family protein [Caenispirillum salinarum]|uniref:NAD-dependent epimerase/dehydratase family protein n=1 Tax=Caenispirillum salinarum TaxID=859058 RepID=UPI0038513895